MLGQKRARTWTRVAQENESEEGGLVTPQGGKVDIVRRGRQSARPSPR